MTIHADRQAGLIVIHVAGLRKGFDQIEMTVPFQVPALPQRLPKGYPPVHGRGMGSPGRIFQTGARLRISPLEGGTGHNRR